ncbi:MAG: glycosyltransferase family 87 protein [Thermodesulfobacteriota bacterium]
MDPFPSSPRAKPPVPEFLQGAGGPGPRRQRSLLVRYGLLLMLAAGWLVVMAEPVRLMALYLSPPRVFLKDFMQEWLMARAVMNGTNPYLPLAQLAGTFFAPPPDLIGLGLPSPHPPPVVLLAWPFGLLDYPAAALAWFMLELACIGASVYLLLKWWQGGRPSWGRTLGITLLVLGLAPFWEGLLYGQLSALLLLLLICVWRSQTQVVAGCFLGAALSLKLMGAPIFLFFLIQKKWRAASVALSVFVLAHIAAALVMGFGPVGHYYGSVAGAMASVYRLVEWNFSVWTLGWRLFAGVRGPFEQSTAILPLFQQPGAALYASVSLLLAVLGTGLFLALKAKDRESAYAVLFCVTPVAGPIAWIHYLVLLLLPFAVTLRRLGRAGFPLPQTALWALLAGALLIPDYTLINALVYFNINGAGTGPVTVSFAAGLLTLVPLAVTLCLMGLVAWSSSKGAKGRDI